MQDVDGVRHELPVEHDHADGAGHPEKVSPGERARWLAVVAAGTHCWAVTVLPGMRQSGLASGAVVTGALALLFQLGSLAAARGRWFRFLAVDCFLVACLASWWFAGPVDSESDFGWFGALGFFAYTFALGSLSTPRAVSSFAAHEARFSARSPARRSALLVVLLLIPITLLLFFLVWEVERPAVGVLAQVLTLGALLLLLRGGALLAERLQTRGTRLHRSLGFRRSGRLLALFALAALGLFFWARFVGFGAGAGTFRI